MFSVQNYTLKCIFTANSLKLKLRWDFFEKAQLGITNLKYNSSAYTWETFSWFHWYSNWAIRHLMPPLIGFCQKPEVLEWVFIVYQKLLTVASTKQTKISWGMNTDMEKKTYAEECLTKFMIIRYLVLSLIIFIYIQWSKKDNCEV